MEKEQGQFAKVNLSIYDWHIVLKILERQVCTVSALQDEAVRVWGAIATQLSEKPVCILKLQDPRPIPGSHESPYQLAIPSPTLQDRIRDRFQRLRRNYDKR